MKRIASFLFLLSILYQSIGQLTVMAYYRINKETIALTKCENRAKPKLSCEGKCYLTKQLNKLDDNREPVKNTKDVKAEISFYLPPKATGSEFIPEMRSLNVCLYPTPAVVSQPSEIFHPPC